MAGPADRVDGVCVPSELARLLRGSRTEAGISQLELSLRLGVSQRHVGFVELGRARPSRPLLINWLHEIGVGSAERSAALLLAGYSPMVSRRGRAESDARDDVAFRAIALHHPNPGLVFDADWRVVRMNAAAQWLCRLVMPELTHELTRDGQPLDMLAVLADPRGWLARSRDPIPVAAALLAQLRAEQWLRPDLTPRVDALEAALCDRYGSLATDSARDPRVTSFSVTIDTAIGPISFSAMQAVFGLPHDSNGERLRAELWFPADAGTAELLRRHEDKTILRPREPLALDRPHRA
jgi:transcriptional regulator with XRE-family HTH domain